MKYFKGLLKSLWDYRQIVLFLFSIKNDVLLITECGFLKSDINCLRLEYKSFLLEQNEEYSDYIKNEE